MLELIIGKIPTISDKPGTRTTTVLQATLIQHYSRKVSLPMATYCLRNRDTYDGHDDTGDLFIYKWILIVEQY